MRGLVGAGAQAKQGGMTAPMKPGQRVLFALRKMIVSGEIPDGARIAEIATAERFGVSRMPVRTALRTLEQEGLVAKLGRRGYAARGVTPAQIDDAIEVRGVLEGLAVRLIASRPIAPGFARRLKAVLAEGDALFAGDSFAPEDIDRFYSYNLAFHDLLLDASGNRAIGVALSRNNHLPLASAAALALDWDDLANAHTNLKAAHEEHLAVADAILSGRADEAEQRMRQHARAALNPGLMPLVGTV